MILHKKERKHKLALRISKDIYKLHKDVTKPVPTSKPEFAGYWRFFKVRDDVLKSSIGNDIQKIVDSCNHWVFSSVKFKKDWKSIVYSESYDGPSQNQLLRALNQKEWDILNFPARIKKYFKPKKITKSFGSKTISYLKFYPNVPEHMLEWDYKKAYYAEDIIRNGEAESNLSINEKWMTNNKGWELIYPADKDDWDNSTTKKRIKNKLINQELKEID